MTAGQEGVSSLEGMSSTLTRQLKQPRERCEWSSIDTNLKKKKNIYIYIYNKI
jgi:hypothetical protein